MDGGLAAVSDGGPAGTVVSRTALVQDDGSVAPPKFSGQDSQSQYLVAVRLTPLPKAWSR